MTAGLACRTIVGRSDGPHLLVTAGVHGDEFEPMLAVRRLGDRVGRLVEGGQGLRGRLTLVPVVNEAAYRRGGRVAEDGLDLARTCPGRPDGSPTERVAHALTALIGSADFYIDLHTGGRDLSVWPMAGYMLHRDPRVLGAQRRMALAFGLPVVWGTSPDLEGRSLSAARDAGVPAIYCESFGGGGWHPETVASYVEGCLGVMAGLGMIDGRPGAAVGPIVVEDDRPGAGHLQVQNPSPRSGIFGPALGLGAEVRAGDRIGTVSDPIGGVEEPVVSRQDGLLLVVRASPRVGRGDCLGVVLECPTPPRSQAPAHPPGPLREADGP